MRNALLLLALLACGPEDVMAGRRSIPPAGPVGKDIGLRRNLSLGSGLANQAYQPVDMTVGNAPSTVPRGTNRNGGVGTVTAARAYMSRFKGVTDDTPVDFFSVWAGNPAAGTETLGAAIYQVLPDKLVKLPGCEWFFTVDGASALLQIARPSTPTVLRRANSYVAGVAWSTTSIVGADAVMLDQAEALLGVAVVNPQNGFPQNVATGENAGVGGTQIAFRVDAQPRRGFTQYFDFY